jgi:hypothetical protein
MCIRIRKILFRRIEEDHWICCITERKETLNTHNNEYDINSQKVCHSVIMEFLAIPFIVRSDSLPTGRHSFLHSYTDVTHSAAILRVGSTGSQPTVTRVLWLT